MGVREGLTLASKGKLSEKTAELEQEMREGFAALREDLRTQSETQTEEILRTVEARSKDLLRRQKRMEQNTNDRLARIERLLEMGARGVTEQKRSPQIIVSLTSYPARIWAVPAVMERLLSQTVRPDRIVLYLSEENFPGKEEDLPVRLREMTACGVEIHWCGRDIRSYKKLIPALKEYPDDRIITVDDDILFDLDMVEKLCDCGRRFPGAICALRAHWMEFDEEGELLPYNEWKKCVSEPLGTPSMRLFATTGGGTLFPPHIFPPEVFEEEKFLSLCGNADDVWFKVLSVMNRTPTVLAAEHKRLSLIAGTQEERLWSSNKVENDGQIRALLDAHREVRVGGKSLVTLMREG